MKGLGHKVLKESLRNCPTIDCRKDLVRDLLGQVKCAASLAKFKARPVAVLKHEHGGVDVLAETVVRRRVKTEVQGATYGL